MTVKATPVTRRKFLKTGAMAAGAVTAGTIAMPQVSRAQTAVLKMRAPGARPTSSTRWPKTM
jgi:anaerobic selenocysteine-containing dehydrogenase